MTWHVEYTDELGLWWDTLSEEEQESVRAGVKLLEDFGPNLRFPYSSGVHGSRHGNMRELRVQHTGRPYRVLRLKGVRLIFRRKSNLTPMALP